MTPSDAPSDQDPVHAGGSRTAEAAWVARIEGEARLVRTATPGGQMTWRLWGDGPPLVMLHGGYGSWKHFARNVTDLATDFTVIAPDMPGFGDSDRTAEAMTVDGMAAIVAGGIRDVLGSDARYRLLGFSFGSTIASHLPRFADGAVEQLTIVAFSRLGLWPLKRPSMRKWRDAPTPEAAEAAQRHNLAALMIHDPARIDDLAVYLQTVNTGSAQVRSLDIVATHDLPKRLTEVTAPVGVIWGERDVTLITGYRDALAAMKTLVPGADCMVIPGAGHWVQYEAAAEFNQAVRDIVARAGVAPSP